ncbi:GLUT4 regulating protein TUG-domain-containing protein [Lineolata rhizophorae]|uniref:GLUT4 regulating protein TUG-domain-containing protein n=1 Tax=Lineolata rhizophorae TaxID=578093 RepID=A0A6A6NYB9_9PEZI|nr:GLUT4 regulating protein TUG-domain-containing protein [Lineolata rhizophorae]
MASHVVVIDANARRHTVRTSPGTYLQDVLAEACSKTGGLSPDHYALKYNGKPVDLSRTVRLSGLPSGARLDLVQASRSAAVVAVALQLPESERNARLTHKFPSTTSVWHILRAFECGAVPGTPTNLNLTQRGIPSAGAGAGRLNYDMPVVNVMGRELASFVDLQKNLSQLGFHGGNVLLRLSFRNSGRPLEEAMMEITMYFKSTEEDAAKLAQGAHSGSAGEAQSRPQGQPPPTDATEARSPPAAAAPAQDESAAIPEIQQQQQHQQQQKGEEEHPSTSSQPIQTPPAQPATTTMPSSSAPATQTSITTETLPSASSAADGPHAKESTIYMPSSSATPQAAALTYNPADYEPTEFHAMLHQSRLNSASRNQRLLSDAELAEQEKRARERIAAVRGITVKARFPDGWQAQTGFGRAESAADLYGWVRGLLAAPDHAFVLTFAGPQGRQVHLQEDGKKLVLDLGWKGNWLVVFAWADGVPAAVKNAPVLKQGVRGSAVELKVDMSPRGTDTAGGKSSDGGSAQNGGAAAGSSKHGGGSKAEKENKLKNLLGFGKKK